jgi:hypothetical protein
MIWMDYFSNASIGLAVPIQQFIFIFLEYRPGYQVLLFNSREAAVIFWQAGMVSLLDSCQDADTAAAFSRMVNEQVLKFAEEHEMLKDNETGSTWNVLGAATNGPLADTQLTSVVATNHFWFS